MATSRAPAGGRLGGGERLGACRTRETAITTSAAPTQPGTPALRCAMTGTGQRAPATVASMSPVRAGGADAGDDDRARAALVGERAQVGLGGQRRGLAHLGAGGRGRPQHAAASVVGEHVGVVEQRLVDVHASRRRSVGCVGCQDAGSAAARLVQQQHRDVVADREDPVAPVQVSCRPPAS